MITDFPYPAYSFSLFFPFFRFVGKFESNSKFFDAMQNT